MSISRQQQQPAPAARHGLHLVPSSHRKTDMGFAPSNFYYKIVAVGAALFLAMTVC